MKTDIKYTRHPGSAQWRDHTDDEWTELSSGIAEFGCTDAICALPDGQIFDGWQRFNACIDLGVEPVIQTHDLTEEQVAKWIISHHKGRRHLNKTELGTFTVGTMKACGMVFAQGRPKKGDQNDHLFGSNTITAKGVADAAGISKPVAYRAIAEVKRETGEAPPKPRQTKSKPDTDHDPFAPDPDDADEDEEVEQQPAEPSDLDIATQTIEVLESDLESAKGEIRDLKEQLKNAAAAADPKRLARLDNLTAINRTLKGQVSEWQQKCREETRQAKTLKRVVIKLEKQIIALEKSAS